MLQQLKHFLRPPETKASRTARLIALKTGGRARWTPRDYAALAREGYTKNAIAHRAVRLVAENAAGVSLPLYEGTPNATGSRCSICWRVPTRVRTAPLSSMPSARICCSSAIPMWTTFPR